jgi:hypothetical protein
MYYCSLPAHMKPRGREPSEVLLRIFGKALKEHDSASSEAYLVTSLTQIYFKYIFGVPHLAILVLVSL